MILVCAVVRAAVVVWGVRGWTGKERGASGRLKLGVQRAACSEEEACSCHGLGIQWREAGLGLGWAVEDRVPLVAQFNVGC